MQKSALCGNISTDIKEREVIVFNNAILYESGEQLCSLRAHSMLLVRADDAREIDFYRCNSGFERHAIGERVHIMQELCDIAATQYVDCPRVPLRVRNGNGTSCLILVRSLMRCAGILMVLELEPDSIAKVMSANDTGAPINVDVFDVISHSNLQHYDESDAAFSIAPYYMMFGAQGSVVQYARAVAQFVGCSLSVDGCEISEDVELCDADTDVIAAMLILLILLFRCATSERLVEFEIIPDGDSLRVRLQAALQHGIDINGAEALEECNRIARMRNMMFDYCVSDSNIASFELCATDIEWSHLGIKTRSYLQYDE